MFAYMYDVDYGWVAFILAWLAMLALWIIDEVKG